MPIDQTQNRATPARRAALAVAAWALSLVVVIGWLVAFESGPAPVAASTEVPAEPPRWRLDVYAHPRCPCTRASIEEISRLAARLGDRIELRFWFFRPESESDAWAHSGSWKSAAAIPRALVATDPGGRLARSAGAVASGHVVLSAPGGRAVFNGGVTLTRGHVGPSPGSDAIYSWTITGSGLDQAPTLGCPLFGEAP